MDWNVVLTVAESWWQEAVAWVLWLDLTPLHYVCAWWALTVVLAWCIWRRGRGWQERARHWKDSYQSLYRDHRQRLQGSEASSPRPAQHRNREWTVEAYAAPLKSAPAGADKAVAKLARACVREMRKQCVKAIGALEARTTVADNAELCVLKDRQALLAAINEKNQSNHVHIAWLAWAMERVPLPGHEKPERPTDA